MARKTAKVGSAGKFGPRYGVRVRKRVRDIAKIRNSPHECPNCHHKSVKRVSAGIWQCRHCNNKFAASAYNPRTMRLVGAEKKTRGGV